MRKRKRLIKYALIVGMILVFLIVLLGIAHHYPSKKYRAISLIETCTPTSCFYKTKEIAYVGENEKYIPEIGNITEKAVVLMTLPRLKYNVNIGIDKKSMYDLMLLDQFKPDGQVCLTVIRSNLFSISSIEENELTIKKVFETLRPTVCYSSDLLNTGLTYRVTPALCDRVIIVSSTTPAILDIQ